MATTEIEKLERRYAENPQGLTFAPLAEVHRKNGEIARALELLKAGLELHPNYIPASIVLGRCHWDLGDLPAAEAAFSHVLRLDDENVIALKSLADINERLERFSDAQRWLNRLISVDRSNEEARQQLARIETAKQQPVPPEVKAPAPAEPESVGQQPEPPAAELEPKPFAVAPPAEAKSPDPKPPEAGSPETTSPKRKPPETQASQDAPSLDLTTAIAESKASSDLQFLEIGEPPQKVGTPEATTAPDVAGPSDEPVTLPGLISQEFVPPKEGSYDLHPELAHDYDSTEFPEVENLGIETAEEVELESMGASEFRVPNAAEDFMDADAPAPPAPGWPEIEVAPPPAFEPPPAVPEPLAESQKGAPAAESTPATPPMVVPEPASEPDTTRRSYSVRRRTGSRS